MRFDRVFPNGYKPNYRIRALLNGAHEGELRVFAGTGFPYMNRVIFNAIAR